MERSFTQIIDQSNDPLKRSESIRRLSGWLKTQSEDTPDGELPEREDIVVAARKLGHLWFGLHKFQLSIKYLKKALKIQIKLLGENHPSVANLWSDLGFSIGETRTPDEAIACHQKSLLIRLNHYGDNHFSLAESYDGVALSLRVKGKVHEAIEYHKKAISVRAHCGQEFHVDTAQSYNGLGLCYNRLRQFNKAVSIYRRLTKINSKLKGSTGVFSLGIEATYYNLGLCYRNWGDYEKSIAWFKRALIEFEKTLYPEHGIIAKCKRLITNAELCHEVKLKRLINLSELKQTELIEKSFNWD